MSYQPPTDIWQVNVEYQIPLELDDPRYVDTREARGNFNFKEMFKHFGVGADNKLRNEKRQSYAVLCGHRGCGKSTELRRLSRTLNSPDSYSVVFADITEYLDEHDLKYADVLFLVAQKLLEKVDEIKLTIDESFYMKLDNWFQEKIVTHAKNKDFNVSLGAKVEMGAPLWLARAFGSLTAAIRAGSSHKEEFRRVVTNYYREFAESFNQLINSSEEALVRKGMGRRFLFVLLLLLLCQKHLHSIQFQWQNKSSRSRFHRC